METAQTVTYDYIAYVDPSKEILHYENLNVDGVSYGNNICGVLTSFGSQLQDWLLNHDVVLPIEGMEKPEYEKTDDEVIRDIQVAVQNLLDSKAQEKLYDDGFSLASYANSTVEKFRNEANAFIAWRDQCWSKCYEILGQYQSGEITRPDSTYVLERLPVLNWE